MANFTVPIGIKIPPKRCYSCDFVHTEMPTNGVMNNMGLWFYCTCGAHLFISSRKESA